MRKTPWHMYYAVRQNPKETIVVGSTSFGVHQRARMEDYANIDSDQCNISKLWVKPFGGSPVY